RPRSLVFLGILQKNRSLALLGMTALTGFPVTVMGALTQSTVWGDDCCHRLARTVESALADEVAAAARAHDGGVHGICGNVAARACVIRFRFASHAEDHFPA